MLQYLFRRLLGIIPLLFGITLVSFMIIHLAPGKPTTVEQAFNPKVSQEVRLKLEKLYGLDKPLHVQYVNWITKLARFDFGSSFIDNRPVLEKIGERIPLTLTINFLSLALVFSLSIFLGVRSALAPGSFFDRATSSVLFIFFAAPVFWIALLFIQFFSLTLGLFPVSGIKSLDHEYYSWFGRLADMARHLALPVLVYSLGSFAGVSRYMRSSMLEALAQPFVTAARAKGVGERDVVYKHALRNAILPIITIVGLSIPGLLGGSVILESIFALPGLGRLFFEAVMTRDYPLIMAEVVLGALLTLAGNLCADLAYAFADPRIKYGKK